jgi:nucleoid-associated protein YgaU
MRTCYYSKKKSELREDDRMSKLVTLALVAGLSFFLLGCPSTPKPPEQTAATPVFNPAGGTFTQEVSVEITTQTEGAEIRYTLDGSDPSSTNGTLYSGPVKISETTTLAAIAVKTGFKDSEIAKAAYTISPPAAVTPPPAEVSPITDAEISAVRDAIARAKEADADYYDPGTIKEARQLLNDALVARTSDPAKARDDLTAAKEKADLAFQSSVEKAVVDLSNRMEALKEMLVEQQADKFLPDEYNKAVAGIDEAKALYDSGDLAGARARAYAALKDMADLSSHLQNRLAWIKILKRDTEDYLQQAEAADANQWAPDQKNKANSLYLQGMEAFQAYRLDDAEESYGAAREAAKDAVNMARENKSAATAELKKKTEALRLQTMKALEDASSLTVVTEDGTVIKPQKWSGEDLLKQQQEQQQQDQSPGDQSMAVPGGADTVVLADESQENLLTQAKELWKLGLEEEAKGNYAKAQEYYQEAQRYVDVYKSFAVKGVYTVRLIPERRDCLWRISEYDFIYGNPRLWPKIWRRNRKLIQNPDLIYPGWLLVIPPQ